MKRFLFFVAIAMLFCLSFSSCKVSSSVMREPNLRFEFNSDDITISEQFSAEATTIKVLWVDWNRLFGKREGGYLNNASVPILGAIVEDQTVNAALYKLMQEHPGYDVVLYPQYQKAVHKPVLGTHLYSKTTVTVTARLGKLKSK